MTLYSIKMRGSKNVNGENKHISGAENIIREEQLERVASILIKRALNHQQGKSESINIKIEKINEEKLIYLEPLKARTIKVNNMSEGLEAMTKLLEKIGIERVRAEYLVNMLRNIRNMRGAALIDINSLKRLDEKLDRGIRVTYMDLENKDIESITKSEKYNSHFIEAIVLATKVINTKGIIAEICYSDDPNYTAGYLASKKFGYVRFDYLKEKGSPYGGRIFLYDSKKGDLKEDIKFLQEERVIVRDNIEVQETIDYKDFMERGII